ncbi:hypothetical protein O181_074118 [Austropuccinia psidii MF-1]|uniref:Uncharacterized protein n=1 Tax=Austropuccinia psidii MF-1 TaxID=1389203 RepID=A0A9Q3FAF3_9BASI|nr:hypothetical protein [Austropuccinia psidii MF-1]
MRLQHCRPISTLTTPYASAPPLSSPWLTILTLLRGPQVMPPTPPSPPLCLLTPTAYHPYARGCPPNMPLTPPSHWPLMILILLQPPQDETTMPAPMSSITNPALPSPPLTICMLPPDPQDMPLTPPSPPLMTPHPCRLPFLRLWSAFPTFLQHRLPSLRLYSACPTCLRRCLPSLGSQFPPNMPLTPPSHWPNAQGLL